MAGRVRVGVIGLGKRWRRYRPALTGANAVMDVRAIWDSSPRRTIREARRLHCEAADGTEELRDRPDLDALLLFDLPWHRLWTLERAAKPVFCAAHVTDDDHLNTVREAVRARSAPVMTALSARLLPTIARLRVLLDKHLGPARTVCCSAGVGGAVSGDRLLTSSALLPALDVCGELLSSSPRSIWTSVPADAGVVNLTLSYPGGHAACITLTAGQRSPWRVTVSADKGRAVALMPRRLQWRDSAGHHALRLPAEHGPTVRLRRFAEDVLGGRLSGPSFEHACRVLSWLRAARQSHSTGGPVHLTET
jgi:hypothetical protein